MKVLSYLEIMSQEGYWEDYVPEFIELKIRFCSPQLNDFYSQPFKPEMITELFEGWTLYAERSHYNSYRNNANSNIDVWHEQNQIDYDRDINNSSSGQLVTSYPDTLDDIINDCARTGIELEWKLQ